MKPLTRYILSQQVDAGVFHGRFGTRREDEVGINDCWESVEEALSATHMRGDFLLPIAVEFQLVGHRTWVACDPHFHTHSLVEDGKTTFIQETTAQSAYRVIRIRHVH